MTQPAAARDASGPTQNLLIVSELRFLRDSLASALARLPGVQVCGQAASPGMALSLLATLRPAILLLDAGLPGGRAAVARFAAVLPALQVIAFGITESEEQVLAWAAAGIAGYVPNTAAVAELLMLVEQISHGGQACSPQIAGSLLRHLRTPLPAPPAPCRPLTAREQEICALLAAGLSNKAIARQLSISLSTAKSHVHNLLTKLNLQRRSEIMLREHAMGAPHPALALSEI